MTADQHLRGGSISMPEIIRTLLNRQASAQESVTIKTVTTGTFAGQAAVEAVAVCHDGETLEECRDRAVLAYLQAHRSVNVTPDEVPF